MKHEDKICILGSKGFVGRNLCKKLKEDGYINVSAYSRPYINLLNRMDVVSIMSYRFDYVFVCSAIVGGIQANINNPYKFLYENLVIQNNVIDLCIKTNVKKVLFLGSSCIYPKDYQQPLKEEYLLKAPVEETNEGYALAKIAGLKLCEYANREFDTGFISLMPCNLYGNDQDYDPIKSHVLGALTSRIINAKRNNDKEVVVWGSGKAKREFLHINDLVDGMLWSMDNLDKTDTYINIGTGNDISIKELALMIKECSGYNGELKFDLNRPDGMMKRCLDVTKINNLGWKHNINLPEGLSKVIKYYERNTPS